jgi:hypothetical protein
MEIKQAFERWVKKLKIENLTDSQRELLHLLRNVAQRQYCRQYKKETA